MRTEFNNFAVDANSKVEVWCKGDTGATYLILVKSAEESGWILAGHVLIHLSHGSPEMSGVVAISRHARSEVQVESVLENLMKSLGASPESSRVLGFYYDSGELLSIMKGQRYLIQ